MYDIVFYEPTCHTIHAEQSCISKCSKKLISKATLLLVRKSPTDKIGPFVAGTPRTPLCNYYLLLGNYYYFLCDRG